MRVVQSHSQYDKILVNTTNLTQIKDKLNLKKQQVIDELVYNFQYIGEQAVRVARDSGDYNDITGNLRSSIGYVVLVDGKPAGTFSNQYKTYNGEKGDGAEGVAQAEKLLEQLRGKYSRGVVLIIVAGMKYAAFVEEVRGKIVLSQAQLYAEQLVNQLLYPAYLNEPI